MALLTEHHPTGSTRMNLRHEITTDEAGHTVICLVCLPVPGRMASPSVRVTESSQSLWRVEQPQAQAATVSYATVAADLKVQCPSCRTLMESEDVLRAANRLVKAKQRVKNRERYNAYMRGLRQRKNPSKEAEKEQV